MRTLILTKQRNYQRERSSSGATFRQKECEVVEERSWGKVGFSLFA